jgi:hypothetical protein
MQVFKYSSMSKRPSRPSAYHRKYRKLRKEVERLLCSDDPVAFASEFQSDGDEQGETSHCVRQEIRSVELQSHSSVEMSDIVEFSSDCEAECTSDCPPISSSDEENEQGFGNSEETVSSLKSELAQWVVSSQITRESCNKLLGLLRKHGCQLPKDRRTLVKTPRSVRIEEKCGGQYIYFGLKKTLHAVSCGEVASSRALNLQINVDGIPLYKSSKTRFWPILCTVNSSQPSIVAL